MNQYTILLNHSSAFDQGLIGLWNNPQSNEIPGKC